MRARALAVLLMLVAGLSPLPALGDDEPRAARLELDGFLDMELDEAHGHVFISQGTDSVAVLDLAGAPVSSIGSLPGSSGMTFGTDRSTLYVALADASGVAAVDTETLAVTAHSTGQGSCPRDVAVDSGLVWFVDQCGGTGSVAALDPVTDVVTPFVDETTGAARLTTSPATPGSLFVEAPASSRLMAFDVANSGAPTLSLRAGVDMGDGSVGLAVTPDGRRIMSADGQERSTADLGYVRSVGSSRGRDVVLRPDGSLALARYQSVATFDAPTGSGYGFFDHIRVAPEVVAPRGVEWGSRLLYVVSRGEDGVYRLATLLPRHTSKVGVVKDRSRYNYGDRALVSAHLEGGGANRTVKIFAQPVNEPRVLVAAGEVDTEGDFSAKFTMRRRTTFFAVYSGDEGTESSSAQVTADVRQTIKVLATRYQRRVGDTYLYPAGSRAYFVLVARPVYGGNCVVVVLEFRVGGQWSPAGGAGCTEFPRTGRLRFYLKGTKEMTGRLGSVRGSLYPYYGNAGTAHTKRLLFKFGR